MTRVLSIDFGQKRIGLAVSDPLGFTAQGLETLENRGKKSVLDALSKICENYRISEAIIGFPVNMDGSLGPKAQEILNWLPELEKALGIPVKTWDERLTSLQANRAMIESGLSRRKQKQRSDRLAATLLLQSYLESRR